MYNVDGVMESRVSVKSKVHLSTVKSALLRCDALAECYSRVKDAGCDVLPDYANGAMLPEGLAHNQRRKDHRGSTSDKATQKGVKPARLKRKSGKVSRDGAKAVKGQPMKDSMNQEAP